jgi:hypothetical protein
MLTSQHNQHHTRRGQTLIETVAGIFMLVMGISAALGLANYSFSSSTNIVKQMIGLGLAREGVEAVKNMRDTNWLQDTLTANACYSFTTNTANAAPCYTHWLNPTGTSGGYDIKPTTSLDTAESYLVYFNAGLQNNPAEPNYYWNIVPATGADYGMDFDPTGGSQGYYYTPSGGTNPGEPDLFGTYYYRQIEITEDNSVQPYNTDANYHRLIVQSLVWWTGKTCPMSSSFPGVGPCGVELTLYLTNWKNYE